VVCRVQAELGDGADEVELVVDVDEDVACADEDVDEEVAERVADPRVDDWVDEEDEVDDPEDAECVELVVLPPGLGRSAGFLMQRLASWPGVRRRKERRGWLLERA
jgi:hypothetical protein